MPQEWVVGARDPVPGVTVDVGQRGELKTYEEWFADLVAWNPEMVVVESTTPTMKFYWRTITELKAALPDTIIVMTG